MANPMMAALMQNKINPMRQAMNVARSAGNPQMMLQQMFVGNPNYAQAQQLIQQHGGNAKEAFYALAQQYGVNPEEILGSLR